MGEMSKKISEEELEKQYEDYRAQFEQWKENNKSSIGTDAYNSYVKQFEQWEREVEARKAQQKNQRQHETTSGVDEKDAEAAAAYAQSQEAYLTHHLKAMEQAELKQRAAVQQQQLMQSFSRRPQDSSDLLMHDVTAAVTTASTAPGTSNAQVVGSPPTLWGNIKVPYDARDSLFAKWGNRAAMAHTKPETERAINPVACWMLLDTLREKKMVLAPHSSNAPPPILSSQTQ